jgi:acetyltransferase-like isoleucine patch superfamily enzyme
VPPSGDDLHGALTELADRLRADARTRWARDLPFDELLFDRWERARKLGFGAGASVYQSCLVFGDVSVGGGTWIGPNTLLDGSGAKLEIGANCSISTGVQIYTHDSVKRALSGGRAELERGRVSIGDNCYVGPNVIVSRGVTIGRQSVIGANSFVNRDVPANSIAVGSPARVIGSVREDENGEIELVYPDRAGS